MKINWKKVIPHISALIAFVLFSCIYFSPQLKGKVLPMGDIENSFKGAAQEAIAYEKATGDATLWTNSMFGGMPTYQISSRQNNNISKYIERASQLFFSRPIGYFIGAMLFFYVTMILLGVNPWLSMLGAFAFAFTTNNLVLFEAGHATKIRALIASSMVVGGTILAYRQKLWIGALAFTIGMAVNINANHFQMTFYLGILLGIFVLFELVKHIKEGKFKDFGIASGVLILCLAVAMGTGASKLMTTLEYSKETMRGNPILEAQGEQVTTSSETQGLDFSYAMNWSNGTLDLFSSYIPGFVGGGSSEPISKNSALAKSFRGRANVDRGPLYWGGLPSTSGPIYFGAGMFFLFFLGFFVVKGHLKWWMLAAFILTCMISMGKNVAWFNKLLFDYFPLFNMFRTPNSVLSVTSILVPFFGILGLSQIVKSQDRDSLTRKLYIAAGVLAGSCLIFGVLGSALFDFAGANDAAYGQRGYDISAVVKDRKSLLMSDSFRSMFIILLSAGLIWLFIKNKIKAAYLYAGLALITIVDLWGVGKRYVSSGDFVEERVMKQSNTPRDVDQAILKDSDIHYRVHDVSTDPWNSAKASYFHKTIGGYHPAKLQRINDLIEKHLSQGNINVFNMLNTKYFITNNQEGKLAFQPNMSALGNVWFVDNILMLKTNREEINGLSGFDPATTALVHSDFQSYFDGWTVDNPDNGRINLIEYKPNKLTYTTTGTGNKLAVFSEMWYGPNLGWQAYLDGQPVDHIRVNYALRAMKVPPGSHEITFEFKPNSYKTGELISLICSGLLFLLLGYIIYKEFFKKSEKAKSTKTQT